MCFRNLIRYRQIWLGVASLWIILYHLPVDLGLLNYPKEIGYGGVDICFFASGIGCYWSLTSDSDAGSFMKRRVKRLMPTYFLFIAVWLAAEFVAGRFGVQMAIGNLLALQHFTGHGNSFNWYVGTAMLFYLLAPYFKSIIDRSSSFGKQLFLVFLFVCSIPFWRSHIHIIVVSRLPIFYIGMLFGGICQQSQKITRGHVLAAVLAFAAGIVSLTVFFRWFPDQLWDYGLYWYPFVLIAPPLCMAISWLMIRIESLRFAKPVVSFLSLCGNYSLELYLVHALLISVIRYLIKYLGITNHIGWIWIAGSIPLVIGCYLLRRAALLLQRLSHRILCGQLKITAE